MTGADRSHEDDSTLELLAIDLKNARQRGRLVIPCSTARGLDLNAAYEVQRAITRIGDERLVGFKIGATTQSAMNVLGLHEPFFGPLYASHFRSSGCRIIIPLQHTPLVEAEIAVGLARDLPLIDSQYELEDVRRAIAWVSPAIEVCACRFDAPLAGSGILLIADSGINMEFIQGSRVFDFEHFDFTRHPVNLSINGKPVATGTSGESVAGHPFGMLAWLANHPQLKMRGLKAGDVITTGSCTGLLSAKANDLVTADFGELGQVFVEFGSTTSSGSIEHYR